MKAPLRILHLEDNPADTLLVRDQFANDELAADVHNVARRAEFVQALEQGGWDLVLADYRLPDFNGLDALKLVRKKYPQLPFILMSGTLGEQAAIESLQGGRDRLHSQTEPRPAAIGGAPRRGRSRGARATRRPAEEDLRRSEKQYRLLFQGNPHPMWVFNLETLAILEVNEAATQHYGYTREEFLRMTLADLRAPERKPPGNASSPAGHESPGPGLAASAQKRQRDGHGSHLVAAGVSRSPGGADAGHGCHCPPARDAAQFGVRQFEPQLERGHHGRGSGACSSARRRTNCFTGTISRSICIPRNRTKWFRC